MKRVQLGSGDLRGWPIILTWALAIAAAGLVLTFAPAAHSVQTNSDGSTARRKDGEKPGTGPRPVAVAAEPDFETQLPQARLLVDGKTIAPFRTTSPWSAKYSAGDFRLEVDGANLSIRKPAGTGTSWAVKSDDGKRLKWLASSSHLAYFVAYEVDKRGDFERDCQPPEIRCLDLDKHRWLERLSGLDEHQSNQKSGEVLCALADDRRVFTLTSVIEAKPSDQRTRVTEYVLRCFAIGQAKATWTVSFTANDEREYTGGYLWAARVPFYPASNLQKLSFMGDRLLVCAEAKQPIYCLEPDSGTELWRCERIWEFKRGFIGPSVWSHYITRFGEEPFFEDVNEKKTTEARKEFEKQFNGSIIGGPVVVPLSFTRDNDTHSIFVAVSREPTRSFGGYLADCLVYELGDDGKPISMVNLPQTIIGSEFGSLTNAMAWCGDNESMIQLRASRRRPEIGMGPGGFDALTHVGWFRQAVDVEPSAWLVTGRSGDQIAFNRTHAVRTQAGAYVSSESNSLYRFPLSIIELESGSERSIELQVPFRGTLTPPTQNYSQIEFPDGKKGYHTPGPYLLGITSLSLDGARLEIVLGMANRAMSIEFDLGPLTQRPLVRSDAEDAWIKALRGSRHTNAELDALLCSTVAYDVDTRRLKALLDAGANPRARSQNGWNALMVAACYGSAAGVDLLVGAGSDVNAHDSNCGGQSVLMWAARSRREAKRKVQRLLAAGADRSYETGDGSNVFMSAVSSGDVAVTELLLGQGMDVNHRTKDGTSGLMEAARSAPASLLPVLLKAGAKVDATDHDGKTVLMYAIEGRDVLKARILLNAGVDPNRKDKQGRTALDMCRTFDGPQGKPLIKLLQSAAKERH